MLIFVLGVTLQVQVPAIILFVAVSLVMTVVAYRKGPFHGHEEEQLLTREFWLFIASLVLLLSAMQIIFSTSIPVFNLLLAPFQSAFQSLHDATGWGWAHTLATDKLAPPVEAKAHFNKWQIPFAFIVAMLVAFGQYLRYKKTDKKKFFRELRWSLIGALVLTILATWWLEYRLVEGNLVALLFATCFATMEYFVPGRMSGSRYDEASPPMCWARIPAMTEGPAAAVALSFSDIEVASLPLVAICVGSAMIVTAGSLTASGWPNRSMMVPREATIVRVTDICLAA